MAHEIAAECGIFGISAKYSNIFDFIAQYLDFSALKLWYLLFLDGKL